MKPNNVVQLRPTQPAKITTDTLIDELSSEASKHYKELIETGEVTLKNYKVSLMESNVSLPLDDRIATSDEYDYKFIRKKLGLSNPAKAAGDFDLLTLVTTVAFMQKPVPHVIHYCVKDEQFILRFIYKRPITKKYLEICISKKDKK